MRKPVNFLLLLSLILITPLLIPQEAEAQWGIGASYELRDEDPQNGFGVRLERSILEVLPVVDLGLRAHFSYFSEENNIDYDDRSGSYDQQIEDYDLGIAATGGVSLGLLKPYVGLGLGSDTYEVSYKDLPEGDPRENDEESKIQWNAFTGAQLIITPAFRPFFEYRYAQVPNAVEMPEDDGRLIFGFMLQF